jgi:hypothetical protein
MSYSNTPILDSPGLGTTTAHLKKAPRIKTINGKIAMVTIGASVQKQIAEKFDLRLPELTSTTFVHANLGQPAKGLEDWLTVPDVWAAALSTLSSSGILQTEVQIVWLQNDTVSNDSVIYPDRPLAVKEDMLDMIDSIKGKFINVKHIYLNGRPYSYSIEVNHAEPKAWLNGLACKWVVEDQIAGRIPIKPWICDLGYMWTNGDVERSDGLHMLITDFQTDDVHLTNAGKVKLGNWWYDFLRLNMPSKRYFK